MQNPSRADWRLEGQYLEACNCTVGCPCVWFNPPTDGECKLLVGWHIERGHLEATCVDDLNVVLACYAPGHMKDGDWEAVLYLDQRVDGDQWLALEQIFSGRVGGQPALLLGFVAKLLGSYLARIDFEVDGKRRRLRVDEVAEAEIEGIEGIRGGVPVIDNPPLCVVSSHPAAVARSRRLAYRDHGFEWDFSGRNGFYSPFVYEP